MKNKILLVIFIISFIASAIISFAPLSGDSSFCGTEPGEGCDGVNNSKYGYVFGVKNSHVGLFAFGILSILLISHIKNPHKHKKIIIDLALIFGTLVALYFIYLQTFVIKKFCMYCMIIDIGMILGILLIIPWKRK